LRSSSRLAQVALGLLLCVATLPPLLTVADNGATPASPSGTSLSEASRAKSEPLGLTPWRPRPVLGGQKTLILLVEFPDVRFRSSIQDVTALLEVVDDWFRTSSYGKMYIDYTIHEDIITLPSTMATYGAPQQGAGRGDDPMRLDAYMSDALNFVLFETNIDLLNFKHIVIIHAGDDEASATGSPNEIWSFCACEGPYADEIPEEASWRLIDDSGQVVHVFWGVSTFSENEPWGIFTHEFSHSLGVSDLYVYGSDDYSEGSGVGFWSMMDMGAILDPPSDLDAWSKYILGWVDPVIIESYEGEYTIYALDSTNEPKALLITIRSQPDEYYFVHARRITGTDSALPSEGVIVFKIDATHERSYEGSELAAISDANPGTPSECRLYTDVFRDGCTMLDAPYNQRGRQYTFTYGPLSADLVLNNEVFWDGDNEIGFKVEPAGEDAFSVSFDLSPEDMPPPTTTTTSETTTEGPRCVIATAAYGSELEPEVRYMRRVRDELIGSSRTGLFLVKTWNAFYYTWSPRVAQTISGSEILRMIVRILLLPLVGIANVTVLTFWAVSHVTAVADVASLAAFVAAGLLSVTMYLFLPVTLLILLVKRLWR